MDVNWSYLYMTFPEIKLPTLCDNTIFDINNNLIVKSLDFLHHKILQIDNLYKDPIAVRNFILTVPAFPGKQVHSMFGYPGYRSEITIEMPLHRVVENLIDIHYPNTKIDKPIKFPFTTGIITTKSVVGYSAYQNHQDGEGVAGVVYFNKDEEISGGTDFFKNFSDKEPSLRIDMKFNRLILYPMDIIHSGRLPEKAFNETFRLTQNIFIHERIKNGSSNL